MNPPTRLLAYITAVAGGAILLWAFSLATSEAAPGLTGAYYAAVLAAMIAASARFPLHLHAKTQLLLDTAPILVASAVLDPWLAMATVAAGTLGGQAILRAPWFQATFNVSSTACQVGLAARVYRLIPSIDADQAGSFSLVLPLAGAGLTLLAANVLLTEGVIALHLSRRPFRRWWREHREDTAQQVALLLSGAFGALVAEEHPWALPLLALPAMGIYRAMRLQTLNLVEAEAAKARAEVDRWRLAATADATPDFVAVSDPAGELLYLNAAARAAMGLPPDRAPDGLSLETFLPGWKAGVEQALVHAHWAGEGTILPSAGPPIPVSQVVLAHGKEGTVEFVSTIARDISETKRLEAELLELAIRDPLTGVFNRRHFDAELGRRLCEPGARGAVVYIDLDRFKQINDRYGHETGDQLLVRVANALWELLEPGDVLARIGGDEFAIMLPGCSDTRTAAVGPLTVGAVAGTRVIARGGPVSVWASVGVALYDDSMPVARVVAEADAAMYEAKGRGGGYVIASPATDHPLPRAS